MKAAVRTHYGSPSLVHVADVPIPEPGPGEVLVRVRNAGLDRGVLHLVEGTPYLLRLAFGLRRPKQPVLGLDLAGVVEKVGSDVTAFAPGDEVLGIGSATFAQYAVAPAKKLVMKPGDLDFQAAAALPVSGLTALQAIEATQVQAGQRVLILGASGGVGSFAVQLAAATDAHVIGVCSAAKAAAVRELGAAEVLDYAHDPLPDNLDVLLAIGGNERVSVLRRCLKPHGRLLVVGGEGGGNVLGITRQLRAVAQNPFVGQRLGMLMSREDGNDLQRLVDLVVAKSLAPLVGARYPLEEAAQALQDMAAGAITGKAVLDVPQ